MSTFLMGILSPDSGGQQMDNRVLYSLLTQQLAEFKLGISELLSEELAMLKYSISETISDEVSALRSLMKSNTKDIDENLVRFESRVLSAIKCNEELELTAAKRDANDSRNEMDPNRDPKPQNCFNKALRFDIHTPLLENRMRGPTAAEPTKAEMPASARS